ncbi:MAG: carbohydrate-binding protein [Bacteroidaceae bacterium]|nr:carbohydrate-binding protein [Bacteroidaceae bacterium]
MHLTRLLFTFFLLVTTFSIKAFETGQTIRLVNSGKSAFVANSSLDENKPIVLWTETNVNAQRWTLTAKTNGTFLLSNDYTGYYLAGLTTGSTGYVGQTNRSATTGRGSWDFVPVEGTTDQYYIYQGTTQKYALAAVPNPTDGDTLRIINLEKETPISPTCIKWTVEVVEPMEKSFTKDKRDDMMNKWKARAYKQANTGWVIGNGGWWGDAEMFEIVLDALETTGDQQYATMFENLYTNFISRNKSTWYQKGVDGYNEYNDDIAWMCIACVRAYLLTGVTKYRTTAKTNFDGMFKRADCYGNDLLQWKHNSGQGTNSCINGPAAVCACYLAIAQADTSYYQKARKTYMAERSKLFEMSNGKPTGKVWDSYDQASNSYNYWASTYNQGTNLGAAIMLYNHYGEQIFKDDADAIIKWSEANMANSKGIIHVCQTVRGDLTNFKGIMLRYLRMYAESFNSPSHYAWIAKNAYHAWNNRNSAGITSSAWLTKSEENFKHKEGDEYKDFGNDGNMTCVSAAFNCHLGVVDSHDAYAMNQAENFNFVRNAPVTYDAGTDDDGGGMVGPMKSSNYIGYRRVDFGDKPASHIDLRVNITLKTTGINVFLDQPNAKQGTLICSIKGEELSAIKTWDTIRKMINVPVLGVHNIYFVSTGTGQTNINWWQFHSLNPVYADLTNGSGSLTTSFAADDASALTDGDLLTACTADIEAGTETWIQYQSPSPMRIYGYQFYSGSNRAGDPINWSLQASNDGQSWETLHCEADTVLFSVCAQRYNADVQTTKAYTHYRLLFNCYDNQTQLSVSEWQLMGRCIDAGDLTADGGDITEGSEALIDHVGTTLFQTPVTAVYHPSGNYRLTAYSITAETASLAPVSWKLEGSANGSSGWKLIDQQTEAFFPYDNCTNVYHVNPDASYLYYRLTINGEETQLTQWQLFGKPDYGTYYADITSIATIISSDESDALPLIDDDGKTYATISGESPYWDLGTPIPVRILGFSLVSADDAELDPQDVTLYGYEEDGTETLLANKQPAFPARGSRLTYTTSSSKLFKRFRLQIGGETAEKSVRLADFELYGVAIISGTDSPGLLAPASVEASATGLSNTELIGRIADGNRTYHYRAAFTEPVSITYTFEQPVSINAYSITASKSEQTRDPADWTLEAANVDGNGEGDWTIIDSRSGETFSNRYATQFYFTETASAFNAYRLTVTATSGANQLQIGEFQLLNIEPVDPTGISEIQISESNIQNGDAWYDLSGRKLNNGQSSMVNGQLKKGIYIHNGVKVAIK